MRHPRLAFLAVLMLTVAPMAFGQHPAPPAPRPAIHLEFFLSAQAANNPATVREYSLVLQPSPGQNQIRTGEKVPIESGKGAYTYQDVGFSLNCSFSPDPAPPGRVALRVNVDISSLSPTSTASPLPIISSASAMVHTAIPLGRRVTISSFADATTHTHYQLAVLAQPAEN